MLGCEELAQRRHSWRAVANREALRHWAGGLQRRAFRSWAAAARAALRSARGCALRRHLTPQPWADAAERERERERVRASSEVAAALSLWHQAASSLSAQRLATTLVLSRRRRRQLLGAVAHWHIHAVRRETQSTLPVRARCFNYFRILSRAVQAWLLWQVRRVSERVLARTLRHALRPIRLPGALAAWRSKAEALRSARSKAMESKRQVGRRLSARCSAAWRRWALGKRAKAFRQAEAKALFVAAARREVLCTLAAEHSRRTAAHSASAVERWPTELPALLSIIRRWAAAAYTSRLRARGLLPTGDDLGRGSVDAACSTQLTQRRAASLENFFAGLRQSLPRHEAQTLPHVGGHRDPSAPRAARDVATGPCVISADIPCASPHTRSLRYAALDGTRV